MTRLVLLGLVGGCIGLAQVRPIRDVRQNNSQGEPLLLNQSVTVTGVVTVAASFGYSGPGYVEDSTGGVALYGSLVSGLSVGDSITITGTVKNFYGLAELDPLNGLQNHGSRGAPAPRTEPLSFVDRIDTAAGYVENEGWLCRFERIWIDHAPGEEFQGNRNYDISDASGYQTQMRIDDNVGLAGITIPDDSVDLVGVIAQYKPGAPHFGGYQVMPRSPADLGVPVTYMPIAEAIKDENGDRIPDRLGETVTVTGIATVPSGLFHSGYLDIYVQDATAAVNVFTNLANVALGDSLEVSGEVDWYLGKTEIAWGTVTVLASGRSLPEARVLTCSQVNEEAYEGELVKLVDVTSAPGALEGNRSYVIEDETGATDMYVEPGTDIVGLELTPAPFTVTGIKGQHSSDSLVADDGYQIVPRFRSDFAGATETLEVMTIAEVQEPGPDGVTPLLLDSLVRVRGRLTGPASSFTTGTNTSLYVEDATQGVNVYGCNCPASQKHLLDLLGVEWEVVGTVMEYNGLTEIANGSMRVVDSIPVPVKPRAMPYNSALTERMESDLVTVVGDVVEPPARSGTGYNITVKNGTAALAVRVGDITGISVGWITKGRRIRVTGITGQYDYDEPYNTGYQLLPRFSADVADTSGAFPPAERLQLEVGDPNPFSPAKGEVATVQVNAPSGYRLTVTVFDMEGRLVRELLTEAAGGFHDLKWDGTDRLSRPLAAGTYLVHLKGVPPEGGIRSAVQPVVIAARFGN